MGNKGCCINIKMRNAARYCCVTSLNACQKISSIIYKLLFSYVNPTDLVFLCECKISVTCSQIYSHIIISIKKWIYVFIWAVWQRKAFSNWVNTKIWYTGNKGLSFRARKVPHSKYSSLFLDISKGIRHHVDK